MFTIRYIFFLFASLPSSPSLPPFLPLTPTPNISPPPQNPPNYPPPQNFQMSLKDIVLYTPLPHYPQNKNTTDHPPPFQKHSGGNTPNRTPGWTSSRALRMGSSTARGRMLMASCGGDRGWGGMIGRGGERLGVGHGEGEWGGGGFWYGSLDGWIERERDEQMA